MEPPRGETQLGDRAFHSGFAHERRSTEERDHRFVRLGEAVRGEVEIATRPNGPLDIVRIQINPPPPRLEDGSKQGAFPRAVRTGKHPNAGCRFHHFKWMIVPFAT